MPFSKLGVSQNVVKAITELGFSQPTPIQEQAIPLLLQGSDIIGQAKTGTGKTAAFAIPILELLQPHKEIQALILEPTRELALQVVQEFRELGKYTHHSVMAVYGGEDIERQIRSLHHGVQIIVCTPGRLLDHLERGTISLSKVHMVVLDEADRMLDMGFIDDIRRIFQKLPQKRQTALFSATMPEPIMQLSKNYMVSPETVNVSTDTLTVEAVSQHFILSDPRHKLQILMHLLNTQKPKLTIIFTRTKKGADGLYYGLVHKGLKVALLHGNLTQNQRERSMHAFRNLHANILVATDIAARGIDVEDVSLVVNYNLPEDAMVYAHRIGRTARAGKSGEAITFVTNVEEKRNMETYAITLKCEIPEMKIEGLKLPELRDDEYRGHGQRPRRYGSYGGEERGGHFGNRPHSGGRHYGGPGPRYGDGHRGGSRPSFGSHRGNSPSHDHHSGHHHSSNRRHFNR